MKKFLEFKKIYEQEITLGTQSSTDSQENNQGGSPQIQVQVVSAPEQKDQSSQDTSQDKTTGNSPVDFFSKLFEVRQVTHEYHLQVKGEGSYAAHVSLNDLYDGILDFTDDLIEIYQGQYGILEEYKPIDNSAAKSKDKIAYFEELTSFIKENRKAFAVEDTHLHNIIDEIVALVYKTLYKLKNLK